MNTKKIIGNIGPALFALAAVAVGACAYWFLNSELAALHGMLALAAAPLALTEEQVQEFQGILGEIKTGWTELKGLPAAFQAAQEENAQVRQQVGRCAGSSPAAASPRNRAAP